MIHYDDPFVVYDFCSQLFFSHVDAIYPFCTVLQQTVRKTAGTCAQIGKNSVFYRDVECFQSSGEFLSAGGYKFLLGSQKNISVRIGNRILRGERFPVAEHQSFFERFFRFCSGAELIGKKFIGTHKISEYIPVFYLHLNRIAFVKEKYRRAG